MRGSAPAFASSPCAALGPKWEQKRPEPRLGFLDCARQSKSLVDDFATGRLMRSRESKAFWSVDWQNPDFKRADHQLSELIYELTRSNADAQAIAELRAGQQYLKAPKARRDIIEELLVKPLRKLKSVPWERVRGIASECLDWLLKGTAPTSSAWDEMWSRKLEWPKGAS
jgi:hypothetical protein